MGVKQGDIAGPSLNSFKANTVYWVLVGLFALGLKCSVGSGGGHVYL